MAKRTTEQSKRTVRVLAIGGTVIATAGVGIAFASNPHPKSTQLPDAHLTALQQRRLNPPAQLSVVPASNQHRPPALPPDSTAPRSQARRSAASKPHTRQTASIERVLPPPT